MREIDVSLFRVALLGHYIDRVARLELYVPFVVHDLGVGHNALAFGANVDDQMLVGDDADYRALNDTIFIGSSFRLFLFEGFECGCEVFRHGFFWFRRARGGRLLCIGIRDLPR
jgi:hypothetical protein